jgi:hypothetical protein
MTQTTSTEFGATITPETSIEHALPMVAATSQPIGIEKEGKVVGQIDRETVLKALAGG